MAIRINSLCVVVFFLKRECFSICVVAHEDSGSCSNSGAVHSRFCQSWCRLFPARLVVDEMVRVFG